jgi:hypothetical protein
MEAGIVLLALGVGAAELGSGPLAAIQAFRSSGVRRVSGSVAARARISTMARGATRFSTGISATLWPSAEKCSGASIWVPVCSLRASSNRLKPFSAKLNLLVSVMPGVPK